MAIVEAKTAAEFAADVEALEAEGYQATMGQWFAYSGSGFAATFGNPGLDPTCQKVPVSLVDEDGDVMVPDTAPVPPVAVAKGVEGMYA